jgi:hypothetical protein
MLKYNEFIILHFVPSIKGGMEKKLSTVSKERGNLRKEKSNVV